MSIKVASKITPNTPWRVVAVATDATRPSVDYTHLPTREQARAYRRRLDATPGIVAWVEQVRVGRGIFDLWVRAR